MRTLFGALLILHGLGHAVLPLRGAGLVEAHAFASALATASYMVALVGFTAAGAGVLGVRPFRRAAPWLALSAGGASMVGLFMLGDADLWPGLLLDALAGFGAIVLLARRRPAVTTPALGTRGAVAAIGQAAGLLFVVYVAASTLLWPWHRHWGTRPAEREMALPGDPSLRQPEYEVMHAVSIQAPPERVWPWLVQIGQDRAGFYSYDWLERLFLADIHNVNEIRPEWQQRAAGDFVRAAQPGYLGGLFGDDLGWFVTEVDPDRALVLHYWGAFVLRPEGANGTRLLVRSTMSGPGIPVWAAAVSFVAFELPHFIMERGMLLGIKERAERSASDRRAWTTWRRIGDRAETSFWLPLAVHSGKLCGERKVTMASLSDWSRRLLAPVLLGVGLAACNAPASNPDNVTAAEQPRSAGERGGQEEFGPYEPVENWPKSLPDAGGVTHAGWTWGSVGGIFAESPDRIWVAMRGELPLPPEAAPWTPYGMLNPSRGNATGNDDGLSATCEPTKPRGWQRRYHHVVFVVDRDGNQVQHWSQHDKLFEMRCGRGPHKIKMSPYDPEKHVWVFDDQLHVIHKFTYDGQLVMTLGTKGQRGRDGGRLFDRPTDIAWLPDGTFFISDGYGGKRVAKFDKDGKFLLDWGSAPADPKNPGPNEWNTVHSIAVSKDRRVFVVDRGHRRIQVFDENGKFLDMWSTGVRSSPYAHIITDDQNLWVSDGGTNRIVKYDLNGNYLYGWGAPGGRSGEFGGPHQLTVDQEGNLYIAEVFNGRVQKFRPKPNADPAKVIGQEVRYRAASTN